MLGNRLKLEERNSTKNDQKYSVTLSTMILYGEVRYVKIWNVAVVGWNW